MLSIDSKSLSASKLHGCLLRVAALKPIALASTVDVNGQANLSSFSFLIV